MRLIQPIHTEADYQAALQLVAPYFENEPELDSAAGAHFEAMVALIQDYETKHWAAAEQAVPTTESRRAKH